ncbi:MAG: LytR C-terminal domain-containing protein [Actinomycetota bacterium]
MTDGLTDEPQVDDRRLGFGLELPERGTGARAARRAAQAAAVQRESLEEDVARTLPGFRGLRQRSGDRREPGATVALEPQAGPRRVGRRWMAGFAAALAACILAAAGLTALGIATLRDSRTGRTVESARPDEPGFEGFLEPTPTLAVRVVHERALDAAYVLSLGAGDAGGGVMLIPSRSLVGSGQFGTLALTHAFGGEARDVQGAIEIVAGVGIDDLVTIDDARWAELVAPVAPIRLTNPDDLPGFPSGPLALAAEEVGPYLAARAPGETDLAALARHGVLWDAWLAQVAGQGEAAVPGELDAGIGRFVRGLAAGSHRIEALPVTEVLQEGSSAIEYRVDEAARAELIVRLVPYPRGTAIAPRTLVRLLDGTGDTDHVARVAPEVIASDSSIVVVGNADHFDYETTQIRYHRPEQEAAAERLRRDLGAGEVIEDVRPIDSFDVTIVLGTDL